MITGVYPEDIDRKLREEPDIKAVVLTYQTIMELFRHKIHRI